MSETVQLFVTCIIDAVFPQVGRDVVEELEHNGVEVEFPADQTCCGQPAYNAGHHRESTEVLLHNLEVLDRTDGPIVIPSGSCADFLIHHGPRLASGDPEKAAMADRVAARIREFTSYVSEKREQASVEDPGHRGPGSHPPGLLSPLLPTPSAAWASAGRESRCWSR